MNAPPRPMSRIERKVFTMIRREPPGKLLELAPGHGALAASLAGLGHEVDVLDILPENFEHPLDEISMTAGNLDDPLPYGEEEFDYVVCVEAIEHLEYQYRFAREVARVLKPGGLLALTTPNITNAASRLRFFLSGFYSLAKRPSSEYTLNRYIAHIYPLTFWQLRHILHTCGLMIERIATDHIRRSALFFAPLYPFSYLFTIEALIREEETRQHNANKEIARQMHSAALFFGRTQIVLARKKGAPPGK